MSFILHKQFPRDHLAVSDFLLSCRAGENFSCCSYLTNIIFLCKPYALLGFVIKLESPTAIDVFIVIKLIYTIKDIKIFLYVKFSLQEQLMC